MVFYDSGNKKIVVRDVLAVIPKELVANEFRVSSRI